MADQSLLEREPQLTALHEIAQLAAGGASNREIAEALFVTRKTVEAHLAATYRKLDVGLRAELADRLDLEVP